MGVQMFTMKSEVASRPSALFFFNLHSVRGGGESKLGPLGTSATEWPSVPAPGDYDDGEFAGMKIGRGNRRTWRKPAPAPLCPPQIPLDQTRAAAVGSQRLTAPLSDDIVQSIDQNICERRRFQYQNYRVNIHKLHVLFSTRLSRVG
jgi:hypothetical protein